MFCCFAANVSFSLFHFMMVHKFACPFRLYNGERTWLAVLEGGSSLRLSLNAKLKPSITVLRGGRLREISEAEGFWKNCCWDGEMDVAYMCA